MNFDAHSWQFWLALGAYSIVEYYLGKKTRSGSMLGLIVTGCVISVGFILLIKELYHDRSSGN